MSIYSLLSLFCYQFRQSTVFYRCAMDNLPSEATSSEATTCKHLLKTVICVYDTTLKQCGKEVAYRVFAEAVPLKMAVRLAEKICRMQRVRRFCC
ncbi:hypothetical protein DdX_21039 [Ditylenchus destructor]|uniref:Uncharacterized protein n=1 Tax=Ditylenchus destructor TaxID=166010 RepID=A0AAD4QRK1_9BILA|nr:hypothetical protein DdX_21039 [Ditylenchus destructor]